MPGSLSAFRLLRITAPAWFTLGSMFCGYLSITFTLKGNFITAAWLIVASVVLDAVDGPLARRLHVASKFGAELDSFADLVSFGLAPSLLFYNAYFNHWSVPGLLIGFTPLMVTSIRLTRYNLATITGPRDYFNGFTSTASGCLLASYVLFSYNVTWHLAYSAIAVLLVVISSALMISGVPYMTVGKFTAGGVWRTPQGALWTPVWLSVLIFPDKAFFPAMLTLMLQGPLGPPLDRAFHHVQAMRR